MSTGELVNLIRGGIMQVFMMILPVLSAALIIGLVVAIFQATTSIQEQTLTFLPKLIVILAVIALLSGWMFTEMREYTVALFRMIPRIAR
ncbi:MAG: flagellar biosynthesis protein FliQ [Treponema sp.]|mgnify:FL=1|jgi:flagellar biosynthetic protein fliQ